MLLGIGIVFQMPTVVFFLAKMRMVTARFLAKNFKYALLLIFIVAAVITPTGDPMTQMIFAAPMVALYGFSIIVAWLVGPKRIKSEAKPEQQLTVLFDDRQVSRTMALPHSRGRLIAND